MKAKKPRRIWRLVSTLLILALITSFGVQFVQQEITIRQQEQIINQKKQDTQKLNEYYNQLLDQAKDKGTLEYIERYMRERFGMVKDNEWIISVEDK